MKIEGSLNENAIKEIAPQILYRHKTIMLPFICIFILFALICMLFKRYVEMVMVCISLVALPIINKIVYNKNENILLTRAREESGDGQIDRKFAITLCDNIIRYDSSISKTPYLIKYADIERLAETENFYVFITKGAVSFAAPKAALDGRLEAFLTTIRQKCKNAKIKVK